MTRAFRLALNVLALLMVLAALAGLAIVMGM